MESHKQISWKSREAKSINNLILDNRKRISSMIYICSPSIKCFPWNTVDENWLMLSSIKLVLLLEQIIKALIFLYFFSEVPHIVSLKFPSLLCIFSWVATEGASPVFYHSNSYIFFESIFFLGQCHKSLYRPGTVTTGEGERHPEGALHQRPDRFSCGGSLPTPSANIFSVNCPQSVISMVFILTSFEPLHSVKLDP